MPIDYLIIVASSASRLAQAANSAGLKPLVIDLFADSDTKNHAEAVYHVASLAQDQLSRAVDYFMHRYPVTHVMYGSGLENYPDSLRYLAHRLTLLGNQPDTVARLQNKPMFFSALTALNIAYPPVSFIAPDDNAAWLLKPMRGQGGVGITYYQRHADNTSNDAMYWQRFQAGTQQSVLFLADGVHVQVIGFNTQWTLHLSEQQPFIFSGIINHSELSAQQQQLITVWLTQLVSIFALRGLNSLDFIQCEEKLYVLEINPRPSASMYLYDANLLTRHIAACTSELDETQVTQSGYSGYQIVYAEHDVSVPDAFLWPEGSADLPESGALYRKGQPICSITTRQQTAHLVLNTLQHHTTYILKGLYSHGIHR